MVRRPTHAFRVPCPVGSQTGASACAPARVADPVGTSGPREEKKQMGLRLLAPVLCALVLSIAACGKGGDSGGGGGGGNTVQLGAALSLTGSLSREGILTKQGYEI